MMILAQLHLYFYRILFFKDFIYLFLERGEGKEKERERSTHVWLPLPHTPPLRTWPTTQACAPTGNWTSDPLVCRPALNPLSHTSQGVFLQNSWKLANSPSQVAQLVGVLSHRPKVLKFDSWSGHIPKLWVQSIPGWSTYERQPINVCLSLPLPTLPFSLKATKKCPWMRIKRKEQCGL